MCAASVGGSCSHMRRTVQPAAIRASSLLRSLCMFRSSLLAHHFALVAGRVAWIGHPCQKQPSTNTASLQVGKRASAKHRRVATGRRCLKNRRPSRWSFCLMRLSGPVSRGLFDCIERRTPGDDAHDSLEWLISTISPQVAPNACVPTICWGHARIGAEPR